MSFTYDIYKNKAINNLIDKFGYKNRMEVPKLCKVVISAGFGKNNEKKNLEDLKKFIAFITGQIPCIRRAKKSISNFKIRKGMPVGLMVTLRRSLMYNFFDKLVNIVLPQLRDFRGISKSSFDGHGNFNLGIADISVFMELDLNIVKQQTGVNVSIVTNANKNEEAFELLKELKFPFKLD